jgi:hypothetical protein
MRKFALLVALLSCLAFPKLASAQGIDTLLRTVTGTNSVLNRNCGTGINALTCQVGRVNSITRQADMIRRDRDYARRQEFARIRSDFVRQQNIARSVGAACAAGDQASCARRTALADTRLMNAMLNACTAGDEASCGRIRQMHADLLRAPAPAAAPMRQLAMRTPARPTLGKTFDPIYGVEIDPKTGYRR